MILDANGKEYRTPVEVKEERCPRCRSTEFEDVNGFGGHWQRICTMCGFVLAHGREEE